MRGRGARQVPSGRVSPEPSALSLAAQSQSRQSPARRAPLGCSLSG